MKADLAEPKQSRQPVPFLTDYAESTELIIYPFSREYGAARTAELIDRRDGFRKPADFQEYAYGLRFNIARSNLAVLDFDTCRRELVNEAVDDLSKCRDIIHIDIARTSIVTSNASYHVYLGLDGIYDITELYDLNISGSCAGFNRCCLANGSVTIRHSSKFFPGKKSHKIKWLEGWSRKKGNTWLRYSSEQLIVPSISVDGTSQNTIETQRVSPLRLRG